jgi:hypothetical protein
MEKEETAPVRDIFINPPMLDIKLGAGAASVSPK